MSAPTRPLHSRSLRTDPDRFASAAKEIGRELDEAIALFRKALPGRGLKLVVPPPLPDGSPGRLSLSAWRRGEQSARVHAGATAAETVRRLLDADVQAGRERRQRDPCAICRGIGWYIASGGIRAICQHPNVQA